MLDSEARDILLREVLDSQPGPHRGSRCPVHRGSGRGRVRRSTPTTNRHPQRACQRHVRTSACHDRPMSHADPRDAVFGSLLAFLNRLDRAGFW
jgi:hypothetical protein